MDTFRTFDQLKTGCWLFNQPAFNLRSVKRLTEEILNGYAMSVEGLYTKQHEGGRFNGKDVFGAKYATLLINDQFINGVFHNMNEVKSHYYTNANYSPAMITIFPIRFSGKDDLSVLIPLDGEQSRATKYSYFTFCVNTVFPDLEMMAAKLVCE